MSILIDRHTRLLVQGITGRDGSFHAARMKEYGTHVVAGVTPGKGGADVDGIPVFDTVAEAAEATDANTSIIFVPVAFAADAVYEAIDAGLALVVIITEGIAVADMNKVIPSTPRKRARASSAPTPPALITPGQGQGGHHAGAHPRAGRRRRRQPLRARSRTRWCTR